MILGALTVTEETLIPNGKLKVYIFLRIIPHHMAQVGAVGTLVSETKFIRRDKTSEEEPHIYRITIMSMFGGGRHNESI